MQLEVVQSRLLDVGSAVATPAEATGAGSKAKKLRVQFDADATPALESWIDAMDEELPQLTAFILPSGAECFRTLLLEIPWRICSELSMRLQSTAKGALPDVTPNLACGDLTDMACLNTMCVTIAGGQASSFLHMARSICRRAERAVVPLVQQGSVSADVGVYMNRLSDYLFTAARMAVSTGPLF